MHRPDLAFLEIIILLLAIIANMIVFYSIKKTLAYLLAPYLAWVIFASALNFAIWQLN
ncbi:MAG: sensory protein TspO, partial [Parcubacteria group bacterium CG22_combo_CG10-13_8_21_14_all_41_9]